MKAGYLVKENYLASRTLHPVRREKKVVEKRQAAAEVMLGIRFKTVGRGERASAGEMIPVLRDGLRARTFLGLWRRHKRGF